MSETEIKKEVEQEVKAEELDTKGDPSAPAKSGGPSEPAHLKNDAEDLGPAVVKPTDKNPDSTKKVKKHSDQVNASAKDGSLPNDNKPSAAAEEAEVKGDKEIVAEIAHVERVDCAGIDAFVHRVEHVLKGFGEKVLGVPVVEHIEFGHTSANQGNAAAEFAFFSHGLPPFIPCVPCPASIFRAVPA